jgi:predicted nucleic acid-binding protein
VGLILERVGSRRLYLDTNVFIYALELAAFAESLPELFEAIDRYEIEAVTSELSLAETLVKPLRDGNEQLRTTFEARLETGGGLLVVPIDRAVLVRAAELRAATPKLKLPDAIHIATALDTNCHAILSNDDRLETMHLELLRLSDIAKA